MTQHTAPRKSFWRTEIADIALLIIFVGIFQVFAPSLAGALPAEVQLPVGIALAIVPALLWLSIFYAQDRSNPEPRHFVAGVAILSGLLAAAVGQPLINGFFRIANWIHHSPLIDILGSILVIGVIQELCKFVAVRYSVYYSNEFDERTDGTLYGTAAGVGYAAVLNLQSVFASGGFDDLGAGVVRIVITTLMHASVGGLMGYFLARDHFDSKPAWWMPLGVLVAAAVNGLFSYVRGEVSQGGLNLNAGGAITAGYNPLPALLLSAVVAIAIFAIVFLLMRRADGRELHVASGTHELVSGTATLLVAGLALVGGLAVRNLAESASKSYSDPTGVTLTYPESWRLDKRAAGDGVIAVREGQSDGFPNTLELRWVPINSTLNDSAAIGEAANIVAVNRAREHTAYKTFDLSMTGAPSSHYVFVANRGGALQESMPVVVLGEDRFIRKGERVYVFSMQSTEANQSTARMAFERFVSGATLP